MTTAKNCYLIGVIKIWWRRGFYWGDFSWWKGSSKFLASGWGLTLHPPSCKNPDLCYLFVSMSDLNVFEFFRLSSQSKLTIKHKKESFKVCQNVS